MEPSCLFELHVNCSHLANLDAASKSDPCAVLFTKEGDNSGWVEFGRTEIQKDTLDPRFVTPFKITFGYFFPCYCATSNFSYMFERLQPLKLVVYDWDTASTSLQQQELIGELETTLGAIAGASGQSITLPLLSALRVRSRTVVHDSPGSLSHRHPSHSNHRGAATIVGNEVPRCNQNVRIAVRGEHLDKKVTSPLHPLPNSTCSQDFFGKSDPFIVFNRMQGGRLIPVYKVCAHLVVAAHVFCTSSNVFCFPPNMPPDHMQSDVVPKTLDPTWRPFELSLGDVC